MLRTPNRVVALSSLCVGDGAVRRAQLTVVVQLLDDAEELVGEAREAGGHVIGSAPAPRHRDARTTWTGLSPGHVSAPTTLRLEIRNERCMV